MLAKYFLAVTVNKERRSSAKLAVLLTRLRTISVGVKSMGAWRDIVSGRRRHRNLVVGATTNRLNSRAQALGYGKFPIQLGVHTVYDFFECAVYDQRIAKRTDPKRISLSACERIFDSILLTFIIECSNSQFFSKKLVVEEYFSICANRKFLKAFSKTYEEAVIAGDDPASFVMNYIAVAGLIPGLHNDVALENHMAELLRRHIGIFNRNSYRFISDMDESVQNALNGFLPPSEQVVIGAGCLPNSPACDIVVPIISLQHWGRLNCSESASDPKNANDVAFKIYYWCHWPCERQRAVEPLPREFSDFLSGDLFSMVTEGQATPFCHECKSYCIDPQIKVEKIGDDAAMKEMRTRLYCSCGAMLWHRDSKLHLDLI